MLLLGWPIAYPSAASLPVSPNTGRHTLQTSDLNKKMVLTTRAISATLLVAVVIAQPSLPPCSLNGQLTNGSCVCLPGWTGETCRTLDLLPAAPLSAENQTYFHPSGKHCYRHNSLPVVVQYPLFHADIPAPAWHDNSWGISVALDDDGVTLHGFMTELEGNCSLSEYGQASQILHVTSAGSPAGPWTVQGVALRELYVLLGELGWVP